MNIKVSLIATCIVAFSPALLAQQDISFGNSFSDQSMLIAENRGGTSNENRGPEFSGNMHENDMIDAYQDSSMDTEMKNSVDSEGYDIDTINRKRA